MSSPIAALGGTIALLVLALLFFLAVGLELVVALAGLTVTVSIVAAMFLLMRRGIEAAPIHTADPVAAAE